MKWVRLVLAVAMVVGVHDWWRIARARLFPPGPPPPANVPWVDRDGQLRRDDE